MEVAFNAMKNIKFYYLITSVLIWVLGYFHTGKFVRPKWKVPWKLVFYVGVSAILVHWFGHWGLIFIITHPLIGFLFHYKVCGENDIYWFTCAPIEKYVELQKKCAKGDFAKSKDGLS